MQLPVNSENEWRYVQEEGFQARRLHGLELHVDLLPATGDGLQANNTEEDEERNNEYNTSAQGWDSWEQPESSSPQPRQERTNNQYNMNAEGWDPWSQPESSRQARQEAEEEIEGDIDELDEAYDRGPGYQSNYATGEDFTDEEAEFREAQDFEGEGFANHEYYITGRTDNYHPTTPGTQIKWLTESVGDPNRAMFKAAAWAYGPCIAAVPYLRPVISIDASFLSDRYKGTLLAACGYDPEQRLLPLAFAIVEKENEQCWGWFMNFASDKDTTLPDKFRKKLANKKKRRPFYKMWNELKTTNPKAIDYLIKCGKENEADDNEEWRPERWAQTYDGGYRWGIMTSNGSESLNSRYKAERRLPVVGLVEGTWYKTVKWFNERKQIALARQAEGERWPKEIQLKLMKHSLKAAAINVITVDIERGEFEAQVPFEKNDPGITWKYQVFLKRNYQPRDPQLPTRRAWCKCRKSQLTGIPCLHVVAVCGHCRWDVSDFVDERYSTENMLKIWSTGEFHCYEDEHEWPVYDGPLIYPDKRLINRGRRKKDRNWMWMDAMRKKNQANQRRRTRRDNNAHEPVSMEDVQSGRRTNPRRTTRPSARNRAQSSTGNRGEPSREPVQPGRNSVSIDPHTESRVSLGIEGVLMAHQVAGDHLTAQAVEEGGYEVGFYG
ncbi:hypothetical protein LUZ63_013540 [Rhynchospora breviuscula]|uniref:SWIM-type domain-containing protein n=1 Tax=Rhynchospora breviuscula TaxID=2022672 RepID=A0A9Q0HL15_9POAL|nr:hypothetical protein LUZ63_013540 [Rhynchospora breviuscula]